MKDETLRAIAAAIIFFAGFMIIAFRVDWITAVGVLLLAAAVSSNVKRNQGKKG